MNVIYYASVGGGHNNSNNTNNRAAAEVGEGSNTTATSTLASILWEMTTTIRSCRRYLRVTTTVCRCPPCYRTTRLMTTSGRLRRHVTTDHPITTLCPVTTCRLQQQVTVWKTTKRAKTVTRCMICYLSNRGKMFNNTLLQVTA